MFIQVIQGTVADAGEMRAALERWSSELGPGAHGWLGTTAGVTDDGRFVAVVRFESQQAARRNSERAEQNQWWLETAKLFGGEVAFQDCAQVETYLRGGSDTAGFVQVIQGRVRDAERMREFLRREDALGDFRPDVIGGTTALHGDGGFTQTVFFTSEQEARAGESKPTPPELQQQDVLEGEPTFLDLRRPWLFSPAP